MLQHLNEGENQSKPTDELTLVPALGSAYELKSEAKKSFLKHFSQNIYQV